MLASRPRRAVSAGRQARSRGGRSWKAEPDGTNDVLRSMQSFILMPPQSICTTPPAHTGVAHTGTTPCQPTLG
eukprot:77444-Chlamydomonas_euryale.AAC.5